MSRLRAPCGGFSFLELVIVIAILSVLASISIPAYLKYRTRAMVSSYVLPILRACMMDISSHCATDTPASGFEDYTTVIGDGRFFNCRDNVLTPGGRVRMEVTQVPRCESNGLLSLGELIGYIEGARSHHVVRCSVNMRPFKCQVE